MANYTTLARPYAKALFAIAKQSQRFALWNDILAALAWIMKNKNTKDWLNNSQMDEAEKIKWLLELLQAGYAETQKIEQEVKSFLHLIFEEHRLEIFSDLARLFNALVLAEEGWVKISVTCAKPISAEMKAVLEKNLSEKFHAKIAVNYTEDTSLLGGLVIKTDDWVMDASVRHQLVRLREKLY